MDDTSPQLGGDLDLNGNDVTGTGEWQGDPVADTYGGNLFDLDTNTPVGSPQNSVYRIRHGFDNFLSNSGMEHWTAGTSSAPDAWTLAGDATIARSSTSTSGDYSAEITFGTANTGELYQAPIISTSVDYTFSCYVQRTSGTGTARLVAQENGGDFTEYASIALGTGAGWQLAVLTVKPDDAGTMRFAIKSNDTTASTWLVDECMFEEGLGVASTWTAASIDDTHDRTVYGDITFSSAPIMGSLTGLLRADSGTVSVDSDVTDLVSAASTTLAGKSELTTVAEVDGGSDTGRTITPDALAGSYAGTKTLGAYFVQAGTA